MSTDYNHGDWKNRKDRSDKTCCCGGHNHSNASRNLHNHSTAARLAHRRGRLLRRKVIQTKRVLGNNVFWAWLDECPPTAVVLAKIGAILENQESPPPEVHKEVSERPWDFV